MSKPKYLTLVAIVSCLSFAGCRSADNQPPQSTLVAGDAGVTCSKCQTTWVRVPEKNGKGRVVGYTSRKGHECPDCRDAVTNFFATGKLEHTCKTCGDAIDVCKAH